MKFLWLSDFFIENNIKGGAELVDDEVINSLITRGHEVQKLNTSFINPLLLKQLDYDHIIVSNFVNLPVESKEYLIINCDYSILEHDHKYLKNRNPSVYRDFQAPLPEIVNAHFYEYAKNVFCQTKMHEEVLTKNLNVWNCVNLGGSVWSDEHLDIINNLKNNSKKHKYGVLKSGNEVKNTLLAEKYCVSNGLEYTLISSDDFSTFMQQLSEVETLVFFPKVMETCCRLVVEARMLNCGVITNDIVGATSEPWFHMKGMPLISKMLEIRSNYVDTILKNIINTPTIRKIASPKDPLLTVVMPVYNNEKYIEQAIESVLNQTLENFELLVIDDGSTDNSISLVKKYSFYDKRIRIIEKKNGGTGSALNVGFSEARGQYGTWVSSDDDRHPESFSRMFNMIENNDIQLCFTSYHSQRFALDWRSYSHNSALPVRNEYGFNHDRKPTNKEFIVNDWVQLNEKHCHSGVNFMFSMELKNLCGPYLNVPGEDYHMSVLMAINSENRVGYIDQPLGWHRFPPNSLTATDPKCTLEAENKTRKMITEWLGE